MELDKRILPGKRPLGCFDTEAAKEFIGKEGYFCRAEYLFSDAKKIGSTSILAQIKPKEQEPFVPQIAIDRDQSFAYEYFLPAEWLKPEEPEIKYRPFSLNEFLKIFAIGNLIDFKKKNSDEVECVMFVGYLTDIDRSKDEKPGANIVMLGTYRYSLSVLFERYEMFFEDEWQPFGVGETSE